MVTLAADLTALAGLATTNTGLTASNGDKFKLEDEVVEFARYQPGIRPDDSWEYATPADPTKIILRRGRDRTLAVPHAAGTTLVPASDAYGAGGGSVSVSGSDGAGGTTTVSAVTEIRASGLITEVSAGIAGQSSIIVSDTDPGTVGAGNFWLRLDDNYTLRSLFVRNPTDTGWQVPTLGEYGDGTNPTPTVYVIAGDDGNGAHGFYAYVFTEGETTLADILADETSIELRHQNAAHTTDTKFALTGGQINSYAKAPDTSQALLTLDPTTGTFIGHMTPAFVMTKVLMTADGVKVTAPGLHFNDGDPIARPEVPATPTAQNVVDALVALGLVTQAV